MGRGLPSDAWSRPPLPGAAGHKCSHALLGHRASIASGDAVLVRTGKIREYGTDNDAHQRAQPGVGRAAAIWLYDQGMAILGTDTTGTEPVPFADSTQTTHQAMLVERGVHLVENLILDELAADNVSEGVFVCLPLAFVPRS